MFPFRFHAEHQAVPHLKDDERFHRDVKHKEVFRVGDRLPNTGCSSISQPLQQPSADLQDRHQPSPGEGSPVAANTWAGDGAQQQLGAT